jgi:hypothetical protein
MTDRAVDDVPPTSKDDAKPKSQSYKERAGSRYFLVDEDYDKKVYENDWKNIIVIILVFIIFYILNILYWWGLVAFGTSYPSEAMWYSVAIFIFTNIWIIGMLLSGSRSNEKLKHLQFYEEKINDVEQAEKERKQRDAQKAEQALKVAGQSKGSTQIQVQHVTKKHEEEELKFDNHDQYQHHYDDHKHKDNGVFLKSQEDEDDDQ